MKEAPWLGVTPDPPTEGATMHHIRIYTDAAGEHRWQFLARNGEVLADGGQGYASKTDLMLALTQVIGTDVTGLRAGAATVVRGNTQIRVEFA